MKALSEEQLTKLQSLLEPEKISRNPSELATHARDESAHGEFPPDVIVYAHSRDDVSKLLRFCNTQRIAVTPWGAGTSLEANPVAIHGGVCLDFSRMNQTLEIRPGDFQVRVQPGVILQDLNQRLSKYGLFFPPDPGAPCTIGGWEARHHAFYASSAANPGKKAIVVDVAVPITRFPEMVEVARKALAKEGLTGPILGHAGDGNFHVGIFYDDTRESKARANAVNDAIVFRAIELGGTATGEHGVGIGKIHFMRAEHGQGYDLMKEIKRLLDPHGILNPGKIF